MIEILKVEDPEAMLAKVEANIRKGEALLERVSEAMVNPLLTLHRRASMAQLALALKSGLAERIRVRRALRVQVRQARGEA